MLSILGELLFTIAIGYMGAIELLFVLKHLYHWSFQHHRRLVMLHERGDEESLKELQEHIQKSINEAAKDEIPGYQRMKDGIYYKDGFRVNLNSKNKITTEETNQSINREIIGSSENRIDKKENEIPEIVNVNIIADNENKNIIDDTIKLKDHEENLHIQEELNLKKDYGLSESISNENRNIPVQENIIIKEQLPLINSEIIPPQQSEENYSVEFDEPQIDIPDQDDKNERINLTQTVKTQFGQTNIEQYSLKSPSRMKIGKSDDSSSIEPWSSQKSSSLSTQQSSSIETAMSVPEMHFDEYERQAPDGEDVPTEQHYSDEYLRSLDGIKNRPLIRDDGSGRRRAFKKRRSSGDSTSSRESRHSREEELKMFTSLEEEEFATMKKGSDGTGGEFTPIRYSSDPNLKVNKPHRRRKRSPVQDPNSLEKLGSNSLEMLNEEETNPWGDVKPEHYKDTEFWKREKSNSIPEELEETGISEREVDSDNAIDENVTRNVSTLLLGKNIPKMSSFEEATHSQHEKVISILKNQGSKDANEPRQDDAKPEYEDKSDETKNVSIDETQVSQTLADKIAFASAFDENKTAQETEEVACNQPYDHSESHLTGGGLRRSPRMDEIDHYEERWEQEERRKSSSLTPSDHQSEELDTAANPNILSLDIKRTLIEKSLSPEKMEIKITYEPQIEDKNKIAIEKPTTPTIEVDYAPDENADDRKVNLHIEEDTVDDYDEDIEPLDTMAGLSDFYDFNASINPPRSRSNSMRRSKSAEPLSTSPIDFRSKSPTTQEVEKINITYEPIIEHKDMIAVEKPSTPTIEVDYAPDENTDDQKEEDTVDDSEENIEQEIPLNPMAGLSDFYDFNASINPPRSTSSSMRISKSSARLSKSPINLRSKSPTTQEIEEPNKFVKRSPSPSSTVSQPKTQNVSFLSDFYDFNVNLNQHAYNRQIEKNNQDTNCDSIAMMIEDLQKLQSEYKLENLDNLESDTEITLQIDRLKNDLIELRGIRPKTPNNLSPITPETPEYPSNLTEITIQTPDYPRSFSTELQHLEKLKDEMITRGFKRSTYVGESTDFSDDYEELREQIKKFRRSQSKSRSPVTKYDEFGIPINRNAANKELQERILEEITKTTVDFQDFSRDLTQDFLEYERRVSDSALIIQKPEILIQFEDEVDDLEPEEYHHFRRFSMQQDCQVEEYPMDDIIFVDQIEVTTADGATETWQRDDTYTSEDKCVFKQMEVVISDDIDTSADNASSNEMEEIDLYNIHPIVDKDNFENEISDEAYTSENKHVNTINTIDLNYSSADECGYSHIEGDVSHDINTSEDKEPSSNVAEVESVFEGQEEENQNNVINELHETDSNSSDDRQTIVEVDDGIDVDVWDYNERTEDSYNEQSECEEFDNTIDRYANRTASDWKEEGAVGGIIDDEFDQMYDEAIKDRKPSGIQRDYDGIVEHISDDKIMNYDDTISIRTEDLLEEILNADEEKYGWSARISRASSKESNRSLLDGSEHRYLANAVSQSISSTRLRSRYGLAPATGSYANFENNEDIDINYKPKREYNWRKNFKLDDDDKQNDSSSENNRKYKQSWNNLDVYDDTGNLLDSRKFSLGGESVTLFSRSPGNSENGDDLENVPEENFNDYQSNESFFREENQQHHEEYTEKIEKENIPISVDANPTEDQLEEIEKIPKKKQSKKKLRKGSRGSLGNDDEISQPRRESLLDTEVPDNLEEAPKNKKKKKKVKENISLEEHIVSEKLYVTFNEENKSLNSPSDKIMESSIDNSLLITHNALEDTKKSQNSEIKISGDIIPHISSKNESDSISPKSDKSNNSTSHSASTSSDCSEKSQKLDKIESSDIIELIRDSSILGSSF